MAKITTSDFGAIHDALNKMIIGEVKAALRLVPGKHAESGADRVPLCRIVVSDRGEYQPYDFSVRRIWLDSEDVLHFSEYEERYHSPNVWDEDDDLLDISDFHYLIEQLKDMMPDGEHDLTNGADLHNLDRKAHDKLNYYNDYDYEDS